MALLRAYDLGGTLSNVTLLTVTADMEALVFGVTVTNAEATAQTYRLYIEDGSNASNDVTVFRATLDAGANIAIDTKLLLIAGDRLKLEKGHANVHTWVSYNEE